GGDAAAGELRVVRLGHGDAVNGTVRPLGHRDSELMLALRSDVYPGGHEAASKPPAEATSTRGARAGRSPRTSGRRRRRPAIRARRSESLHRSGPMPGPTG